MLNKRVSLLSIILGFVLIGLAACSAEQEPVKPMAGAEEVAIVSTIEGEVFYRERMMLPPGAEVEVQLQDVSRADALATVLASVMFKPESGPPYPFSIDYKPADIDERMRYSLRATITVGNQLMFTSTEFIDPFSGETLNIMLQRVPEPVKKSPVVPQTETDGGPQAAVEEDNKAPESSGDTPSWELESMGGEPAPPGAGGAAIDLVLNAQDGTASGFSGCNRYQGSFAKSGNSTHGTPLKFGPMAVTMRACAEGEEAERAYLKMLDGVDGYRIQGSSLALLQGAKVVATFKLR